MIALEMLIVVPEPGTGIDKKLVILTNCSKRKFSWIFSQKSSKNIPNFSHFSNIHEMSNHMLTETAGTVDNFICNVCLNQSSAGRQHPRRLGPLISRSQWNFPPFPLSSGDLVFVPALMLGNQTCEMSIRSLRSRTMVFQIRDGEDVNVLRRL